MAVASLIPKELLDSLSELPPKASEEFAKQIGLIEQDDDS
jgi:hypothetical protein